MKADSNLNFEAVSERLLSSKLPIHTVVVYILTKKLFHFFFLEKDEEEEAELAAEVSEDSLGSLWDDEDSKVRRIKFRCTDPNITFHLARFQIRLPVVR